MKVQLFAVDIESYTGEENIGISRLTAFLNENNVPVVSEYLYTNKPMEQEFEKIDLACDIYGFSAYPDNIQYIIKVADKIKKINKSAVIYLGSMFATLYADAILEDCHFVDFIILGYGEFPLLYVINELKKGTDIETIAQNNKHIKTLKNKKRKEFCCTDINLLPLPDREYLKKGGFISAYICNAQGCTGNCSFCVQRKNIKWSGRTAEDIFKEIIDIYKSTGIRIFKFTSGSFEDPGQKGKQFIYRLCMLLKEYPVQFSFKCYLRAESFQRNAQDIELLSLMKEVGFANVLIGIEAGNEEDLILYNKRASLENMHTSLELMQETGIFAKQFGFIAINPYTNRDRLSKNCDFLIKYKCPYVLKYISSLFVSYDTAIYYKLKEDNLLKEEYSYRNQSAYYYANKEADEISGFIVDTFYSDKNYNRHEIFYGTVELFYQSEPIVDLEDLKSSFEENLDHIFNYCREYFTQLFKNGDLEYCKRQYPEFMQNLLEYYEKCNKQKNKLLKRFMRLQK